MEFPRGQTPPVIRLHAGRGPFVRTDNVLSVRVLFLLCPAALWGASCDMPAAVEQFRRSLPEDRELRLDVLKNRAGAEPTNFHIQRLYVDSSVYWRKADRDHYQALLEDHPADLNYRYLYARSLLGSNSREAIQQFRAILEKDSEYPWVHVPLMEIYRSDTFKDLPALRASFQKITSLCPGLLAPYQYLGQVDDPVFVSRAARHLRQLLASTSDRDDLGLYASLWAAEFRTTPKSEQEALRKQVAVDMERLKGAEDYPPVRHALHVGAQLRGDKQPEADSGYRNRLDSYIKWREAHPRPLASATRSERDQWGKALLAESAIWRQQSPGDAFGYLERLNALMAISDSTPQQIDEAAAAALSFSRSHPYENPAWPVPQRVAQAFLEHGVYLDRIPALTEEAIELMNDPEAFIEIDLYPTPITARNRTMLVTGKLRALHTLMQAYEAQGRDPEAATVVARMEDLISSNRPSKDAHRMVQEEWFQTEAVLFSSKAEFARQGRKLDALLYYRRAQLALDCDSPVYTAKQAELWKELGGSSEAWQAWNVLPGGAASNLRGWTAKPRQLPPFSLRDTSGKEWTLANLKGKTTFVNLWATWCEPCREDLPYVQKLADQLKDHADVQVITLNVDDNPGLIEPFLKRTGYRFTVIPAKLFAEGLMDSFGIPRDWIIDKDGMLIKERQGFSRSEQWMEETLEELRP